MIKITNLEESGKKSIAINIKIPGSEHPDMMIILCKKGYIMCGYLNMQIAEKLEDTAVIIGGANLEDIINGKATAITKKAYEIGIRIGMFGKEIIKVLEQ